MPKSTRTPADFVRTVLRILLVMVAGNLLFSAWIAATRTSWQALAMVGDALILVIGVLLARRALVDGAPERALTRLYLAIFAAIAVSLPLAAGSHTLVGIGLVVFVLGTAPTVLPPARVDRWAQGTVAFAIASGAFDVLDLPTQVIAARGDGFGLLIAVGLALFAAVSVRWFHRYPLQTKLTIAFLLVATIPLVAAAALQPAGAGTDATTRHLVGLAVAAIACAVAFVFGKVVAAPLTQVAAAMERFTGGDLEARARARGGDEIAAVASRFNALAVDVGRLLASLRAEVEIRGARERELQAVNEALTAARDQATAASRSKSTFLAHMSHELRTPLNAIIGYGEMIVEDTQEPTIRDDAERVLTAARHLLGIISDILDISKVEAGKLELEVEDFDLIRLVRGTCESSRTLFEARGNQLVVVCDLDRLRLTGDARKVRQVLLNLLSNAAKFTRGARVWCELRLCKDEGAADPSAVEIVVRDEGIGIPADRLATLFEPFTQVDSSFSRAYEGTGLGLAISRLFIEKMGGTIGVRSVLGAGSTFTVRLPLT